MRFRKGANVVIDHRLVFDFGCTHELADALHQLVRRIEVAEPLESDVWLVEVAIRSGSLPLTENIEFDLWRLVGIFVTITELKTCVSSSGG